MLSIIIPTHSEEKRISATLQDLTSFLNKSKIAHEIIVVDDGIDNTAGIVKEFAQKNKRISLMHFPKRLGKGKAIKEGLLKAQGNAIIYDADASTPPHEIPKLIQELGACDLVIGSRRLPSSHAVGTSWYRQIARSFFNLLVRLLFGLPYADTQCGFKAIKHNVVKKLAPLLTHAGYLWDVELLYLAKKHGLRVKEIPVEWEHKKGGPLEAASVVRVALKMLWGLIKLRLSLFSRKKPSAGN